MRPSTNKPIDSYSALEEKLNALTHLLGWILAVVGTIALFIKSQTLTETIASIIFGSSMIILFAASTLYHWFKDLPRKVLLKRADHIAIYLLIAGSYTPFLLVSLDGWVSTVSLIAIWCIALMGVLFKTIFNNQYPKLAVGTYAVMGWLALVIIVPIYNALPWMGFVLLFLGGLAYSLGIPFYMAKHKQYTHALWHVFVLLGAGCHYYAIYGYVIS